MADKEVALPSDKDGSNEPVYNISLSYNELCLMIDVFSIIGGPTGTTRRKYAYQISRALEECKSGHRWANTNEPCDYKGGITFYKDYKRRSDR